MNKVKNFLKDKKVLSYIAIFLVTLFSCIPMFSKYMGIAVDDGIQHICRIIGTYDALKEGNLFPVILSGFCNGFGYSWSIFYSPLTAYLPLIFKIFTDSFVLSLKLFMIATMFLSGVFMYKLVYRISGKHLASFISAIIYITAPYHLSDLYNRIAIAELASFMFLPMVFLGLYDLLKENKKTYYIAIGAIGLTLTHNVITMYTAIFCLVYLLLNYKELKNKKVIKAILINVAIILLCTSFYWIPLIEHYFGATYEVFVPGRMFGEQTLTGSKLPLSDLFITKRWGLNFQIGLPIILGLIFTFVYRRKIEEKYPKTFVIFLAFGLVSIMMTLQIFPFEYMPSILKMLQFAWRMMLFASFFLSIISGIAIDIFVNKNSIRKLLMLIVFVIYTTVMVINTKYYTVVPFEEEDYRVPMPLERIVGKIHPGCATFEYLPEKAYDNLEYIKTRSDGAVILTGNANITNETKNGTNMQIQVEDVENITQIELPYIYYLGYTARLTDENNNVSYIDIKESDNGFCMIEVSNVEKGTIEISYEGTILMKLSYVLTGIGIISLTIYQKSLKNSK